MSNNEMPFYLNWDGHKLHELLGLISDGVWDWDANTGYVYRNSGWYRMLGYECNSLPNTVKTWEDIVHPEDYPNVMKHFENSIYQNIPYHVEYRCRCKNGEYIWIEDRAVIILRNKDNSVSEMLGVHRNINDSKQLMIELKNNNTSLELLVAEKIHELLIVNKKLQQQLDYNRELAERDPLTKAANRYRLEKVLKHECERSKRFQHPLSMIAIDIDDFKLINDRHGHFFGDRALILVADKIRNFLRHQDTLARWGGDEFIIIMPLTTSEDAFLVAESIRKSMNSVDIIDNHKITVSFGVTQFKEQDDINNFLHRADQILYSSKKHGKNKISKA
ncbi:Heme-regulated two-component response regulator [Klebsiella variicola]|uniref:sensor domain-containing diguanylate cyclase n=2 Tax=Klebsiella variicola TaxID=244366 RepID=UPI0009BBE554|nr:sensor domain-containing diguanylate cyclase [Klebsiella variicola]MEC6197713.1 sensor domain-containing diguanylate cyclase [Klebsiella variicola]SLZ38147.1 Heme-regulated two-component response regulator [Klebsiella variicola]HCQ8411716.1 sensor domain-containing diguanylate cyclase [Klebsiella variicola]